MLAIAALVSIGYAHFGWDTVIRIRKRRAQLSTYPLFARSR